MNEKAEDFSKEELMIAIHQARYKCLLAEGDLEDLHKEMYRRMVPLVIDFGEHKGKVIKDLPINYALWLLASGRVDGWEHRKIREELKRYFGKEQQKGEEK